MKKFKLNLRLFEGEGSGEEAQAAAENSGAQVVYGKDGQEPGAPVTRTPDEIAKEFDALIKGEYKDAYNARVKSTVQRRLGDQKTLQDTITAQRGLLEKIAGRYGIEADDIENLSKAIDNDDAYWQAAAEEANMTVPQYRRMKSMEQRANQAEAQLRYQEREAEKARVFAKWDQEAEELAKFYPAFDLETEMGNPTFMKMLANGFEMKNAYEAVHHDELLQAAMAQTAQNVAMNQAAAVRSQQARPQEGGTSSRQAVVTKRDPSKLTDEDLIDIRRRVEAGERISF